MNDFSSSPLPTEDNHFKVHYAPWIGFTLLPIGILNLALVGWLILLEGKFNSGIITGVLCTAIGYLYCTRPYFAIAPNRLTIYNLLGSVVKRYPFASFGSLRIEDKQLYVVDAEAPSQPREKVKVTRWMVKPADWKKLEEIISISIAS